VSRNLSFREWQDAIENIRDVDRLAQLGYTIFLNFYGAQQEMPDEAWNRANISASARLLDFAFVRMRLKVRRDLRKQMLFKGKVVEPALWEDTLLHVHPHDMINERLGRGERPTLAELLIMAHDIEAHIRPNLLRLLWVAEISDGSEIPYAKAMLKSTGAQGSVGYALNNLRVWVRSKKSKVLPNEERKALRELVASLKSSAPDQIGLDDLRNWVDHRDFWLRKDDVMLHFHRPKGDHKPRRILLTREKISGMRLQMLGLISLLKSFEWMFRVHEAAPAKRRRPV